MIPEVDVMKCTGCEICRLSGNYNRPCQREGIHPEGPLCGLRNLFFLLSGSCDFI
jgi:hypothetical protein